MQKDLEDDLMNHLKKTVKENELIHIYDLCLSVIEVAAEKNIDNLSVKLPPFITWGDSDHSPVKSVIQEWKLDSFVKRAKKDLK